MQPYFLPFPGYFRLFAAADEVLLLDTVQFSRGSFVNRNRFRKTSGDLDWLTLPLRSAPLGTAIRDLSFSDDADERWEGRLRRFEIGCSDGIADAALRDRLRERSGTPVDFIVTLLETCCRTLGLPFSDLRASRVSVPEGQSGQDRVLALAEARGAGIYLNLPGGRALYDPAAFAARGMRLRYLPDYRGPLDSVGQRLHDGPADALRAEIVSQCTLEMP